MTQPFGSAPTLTVTVGPDRYALDPASGPVVIGREPQATIRILRDDRISRRHLRVEPYADGWQAIDTSSNGMYVDGVRRSSAFITAPTTIHLVDVDGVAVQFTPAEPVAPPDRAASAAVSFDDEAAASTVDTGEHEVSDPSVLRAGRAVAARRRELDITQRSLARDKIINAGTLISFEKGRSWPRRSTLTKLEDILDWPRGTIVRLRTETGGAAPVRDDEATEVMTDSVHAPLMAEAVELAMHTIEAAAAELPEPADPDFGVKATPVLADLRRLESLAANAAKHATGTPSIVLALSTVRRRYSELMLEAAKSPSATLGQRLYEVRHRADLNVQETANAVGLSVEVIAAAEAESPIPAEAAETLKNLVAQLSVS